MKNPLEHGVVYISPLGRRCRWVPFADDRFYSVRAFFVYLDGPPRVGEPEGFSLAAANFHLLKPEVRHAAAR